MLEKRTTRRFAIACMVGMILSGAVQNAGADYTIGTTALQATGPCLFSEQLQTSAAARSQFIAKVTSVLGTTATASNSVEEMYSNIQPASYSVDTWGIGTTSTTTTTTTTTQVDPLSADCLSCHDGVAAVAVTAYVKNDPFAVSHGPYRNSDHPIGMDYGRYASVKGTEYKSLFNATSKMVLVDGKVGCLTCHDPLNAEKGHLVMSDNGSALCLTCHNK